MKNNIFNLIKSTSPIKIASIAGVTKDMACKYKSSFSLPPLDKAILIEDKLGIPVRAWVELKKNKEAKE